MTDWQASSEAGFFKPSDLTHYDPKAVGLCLSGGGYRATLFHTGAILRMNELGILPRLDRVSSVSGGSITAGILAKGWAQLGFDQTTGVAPKAKIDEHLLEPVLDATSRTLDVRVSIEGFLPFLSAGNRLARLYNKYIFDGMRLPELPARPKFIFNATNLQTGGLLRFTRTYIADWRALYSTTRNVRLADAVAGSSAFPPVLAPLRLDLGDEDIETPKGARFDNQELHAHPVLVDGGVYDNLGLESVWKRCGVLIASYAGHNAAAEPDNFDIDHMVPVLNTFLASSVDWRERFLISLFQHRLADGLPERLGTYWTAGTRLADFPIHDGWAPTEKEFTRAMNTPTRLEALDREEQQVVINAGYAYADAGLRSYLLPDAPRSVAPPALP